MELFLLKKIKKLLIDEGNLSEIEINDFKKIFLSLKNQMTLKNLISIVTLET